MIYKSEHLNNTKYTEELFTEAFLSMSDERKAKAERYKNPEDKRLCVFSDMLLRDMLKEHFGIDSPRFSADKNGKPILANSEVFFNISHSKDVIACAVDTKPVGIDVEVFRDVSMSVVNRVCTPLELEFIFDDTTIDTLNEEALKRFFIVWTAKEAYLKYTGKGLSGGLKNIVVTDSNGLKLKLDDNLYLTSISSEYYALAVISENPPTKI